MAAIDHENMRLLKKLHSSVASVSFKKLDKEYMKHVRDLNIRKKSDNIVRVANFSKDPKYKITYQRVKHFS